MKLVIVESPTKAKTIENYLGNDYKVISTKGAVRDLATKGRGGFGIDFENNYKCNYEIIKGKNALIKELKQLKKEYEIILATDPDREGEAIAWHLADLLKLDINQKNRTTFNEITKEKINTEITNLRKLDMNLVHAQEVRRIIDRIIGFSLSQIVQNKIGARSAGRVQSIALKLVCDLEKEIQKFIPQKYYDIKLYNPVNKATFKIEEPEFIFQAEYLNLPAIEIDEKKADQILKNAVNPFTIISKKEREVLTKPKKPFITSSIQQESFNKFGYTARKTMTILQSLFEGIELDDGLTGLITYIRTDSRRISDEFLNEIENYINLNIGTNYLANYELKNSGKIQDAHEAIRPVNLKITPDSIKDYLSKEQYNLYKLIYERTISIRLKPAITKVIDYTITSNGENFKFSSRVNIFKGCLYFENIKDIKLNDYSVNDKIDNLLIFKLEKETKPKARYNEASLIKELEENGIGRPSTYATIISALKNRDYVENSNKTFKPTNIGILTTDRLQEYFNQIINILYTSNLEKDLDKIALGNLEMKTFLDKFTAEFFNLVEIAKKEMKKQPPEETGEVCPECGHKLVYKNSRFGRFIGCSNFPNCKHVQKIKKY